MLQIESYIKFKDNSTILNGKIIHIFKSGKKKNKGTITDLFLFSPQKTKNRKYLTQKTFYGIITTTRKKIKRLNGHYVNASQTSGVTLQQKDLFKPTHIKSPIFNELRFTKLTAITLAASKII